MDYLVSVEVLVEVEAIAVLASISIAVENFVGHPTLAVKVTMVLTETAILGILFLRL